MDKPARLTWRVQNVKESAADLEIYGIIGDPWDGTTSSEFNTALRALDVKRINFLFNSPGGYVSDGLAMYNAILGHPADKWGYVEGSADSAASFVFQAMDHRIIAKTASMFIHRAQGIAIGDDDDALALAEMLKEHSENIAGIYAERTGGTVDEWLERMSAGNSARRGSQYRGQQAVDVGLADDVGIYTMNYARSPVAAQATPVTPTTPAFDLGKAFSESARFEPVAPSLQQLLEKHAPKPLTAAFGKGA